MTTNAVRSALVAGPTGLVGNACIEQLLRNDRFDQVIALTRRPLDTHHPGLSQWIASDGDLINALRDEPVDTVLCCLGTTIKIAGSQQAFLYVDKDLVIALARWAKRNGVRCFCVVSAIGADAKSRIFYNRVKGEMEEALKAIGLPKLHIFHPSILTGPRKEKRSGERIGIAIMEMIGPLLIGALANYKPMPSDVLARAMINASLAIGSDAQVMTHAYGSIVELSRR